ncbi:MAG: hypothetical protein AABY07_10805 [Nanoarchaeota archaeon]
MTKQKKYTEAIEKCFPARGAKYVKAKKHMDKKQREYETEELRGRGIRGKEKKKADSQSRKMVKQDIKNKTGKKGLKNLRG